MKMEMVVNYLTTSRRQKMAESGFVSSLSGATLEKAIRELNEPQDNDKRLEVIGELRQRLLQWKPAGDEEDFSLSRVDDDKFLLRFLRTKKFDVDRAEQLFINYHKYRHRHAELLGEITPQAAEYVLSSGLMCVLPHRTLSGCKVLVARLSKWDMDAVKTGDMLKAMLVIMDKLLEDEETQVHGVTVFEDLKDLSIVQVFKLAKMEHLQKGVMVELIQEALPARFKGIHVVNQPWYISIIMAVIMPFMKQKLRDRIHLHGDDYGSLNDYLPPEHLPEQFGGQLSSLDDYTASFLFDELQNN